MDTSEDYKEKKGKEADGKNALGLFLSKKTEAIDGNGEKEQENLFLLDGSPSSSKNEVDASVNEKHLSMKESKKTEAAQGHGEREEKLHRGSFSQASTVIITPSESSLSDESGINKSITQIIEVVTQREKLGRLQQIVGEEPGSKIIVFCSSKKLCKDITANLNHQFVAAAALQINKSLAEKISVLGHFRTGRCPVLVTDVPVPELDDAIIEDIRMIVNFDFPTGIDDYLDRIKRLEKAEETGGALVYTFFTEEDSKYAPDLVDVLKEAKQRVPPEILHMASDMACGGPKSDSEDVLDSDDSNDLTDSDDRYYSSGIKKYCNFS